MLLFAQVKLKEEMPLTYDAICKKAADQWPGDFEMQKFTIEKQCTAYYEYAELMNNNPVPKDIMQQITTPALKDWCENDWIGCVDNLIEKGTDETYACWKADWEMIVFTIKKQVEAYNALK
jgi:hypothetical protein